jgi:uncharacterized membrane protein
MISHVSHECSEEIIYSGDIYIIAAIAGLLKPFVVKNFCKTTRRHIDKPGIAKILQIHKT